MTRKSKREIQQALDDMEAGPPGDYPQLDSLALLLSYDWEIIDDENNLWERQDTGQVYHFPQEMQDSLESALFDE